jgi:hypothetical protein
MNISRQMQADSPWHGRAGFAGFTLGAVGVLIFSLTMPMTKIALAGDAMSPWFVWAGRAVLAAFAGLAA